MQELVFNHIFKQLKDHVLEHFRLLEFSSKHFLKFAEAFVVEVFHIMKPVPFVLAL